MIDDLIELCTFDELMEIRVPDFGSATFSSGKDQNLAFILLLLLWCYAVRIFLRQKYKFYSLLKKRVSVIVWSQEVL